MTSRESNYYRNFTGYNLSRLYMMQIKLEDGIRESMLEEKVTME